VSPFFHYRFEMEEDRDEYQGGQFMLQVRTPRPETFTCPACKQEKSAAVDPVPGAQQSSSCTRCGAELRISSTHAGVSVDHAIANEPAEESCDEEFLQKVREAMPAQPWPTGAARLAANRLGVSPRRLSVAIDQLVKRGVYKMQVNGALYEPVPKR
jgi:transcription elongation factor Elf1